MSSDDRNMPGMFWEPFHYGAPKEKRGSRERGPRPLPEIPDLGWAPPTDFPDLRSARNIGIDIETYDPDLLTKGPGVRRDGYIVGVSVAAEGIARYYPIAHCIGGSDRPDPDNLDRDQVLRYLDEQLSRPHQVKVGANILYDLDYLTHAGVRVAGKTRDVQFAEAISDEYIGRYSLESIAKRRLGEGKETSELYRWAARAFGGSESDQRKNIWRCPARLVGRYAEQDAALPLRIARHQYDELHPTGQWQVFLDECNLIPLLLQMRQRGVLIDLPRCEEVDALLTAEVDAITGSLPFSVYSAEEIARYCDANSIRYPRTEKGAPSFVKDWLQDHPDMHLRNAALMRKLLKLRDTFVRAALLGTHINGVVHCEFHPLRTDSYGTVSGRFSASHPNLQQIPARDKKWAPLLRSCFVPPYGRTWMKNDLSQIEYRLGVHYGVGDGIEEVRRRYREDRTTDFYSLAAALTGLERGEAKSLSLGTLYGMGKRKFARMIHRSEEEADLIFAQFNEGLPFMRATYEAVAAEALESGIIPTISGRICHTESGAEHKSLNRKLQGSCADWIKKAMRDAYHAGLFDVLELYLTVHDELDSGVPPTPVGLEAARELHYLMENAYHLCIPTLAGIDLGPSWGSLVEHEVLTLDALQGAVRG